MVCSPFSIPAFQLCELTVSKFVWYKSLWWRTHRQIWPLGSAYCPYFPTRSLSKFNLLTSFINLNESFILIGFNSSVDVGEGKEGISFFPNSLWLETMKNQLLAAVFLTSSWFICCQKQFPVWWGRERRRIGSEVGKPAVCWLLHFDFFLIGSNINLSTFVYKPNRPSCSVFWDFFFF